MRIDWDDNQSERLKRERGLSLEEAALVFSDGAIGFAQGQLITLIHEHREDEDGDLTWLVTYWKATKEEAKKYEKRRR